MSKLTDAVYVQTRYIALPEGTVLGTCSATSGRRCTPKRYFVVDQRVWLEVRSFASLERAVVVSCRDAW